jgi:hypothetical protein
MNSRTLGCLKSDLSRPDLTNVSQGHAKISLPPPPRLPLFSQNLPSPLLPSHETRRPPNSISFYFSLLFSSNKSKSTIVQESKNTYIHMNVGVLKLGKDNVLTIQTHWCRLVQVGRDDVCRVCFVAVILCVAHEKMASRFL